MHGTSKAAGSRPAWVWLYAVLALTVALFALVDALPAYGPARIVLELLATLVVFGAMAIWVRANRTALDMAGPRATDGEQESLEDEPVPSEIRALDFGPSRAVDGTVASRRVPPLGAEDPIRPRRVEVSHD